MGLPNTLEHLEYLFSISREDHGVVGHERLLSNGKVVVVRPHTRKNPLRKTGSGDPEKEDNYIVYLVYDADQRLRYVGEGRPDRPNHVNSGASHNPKINEHFYTRGPMRIRLLHEGLTKDYAKAIEFHYIKQFGSELWNQADNEHPGRYENPDHWEKYRVDLPTVEVLDEGKRYDQLLRLHGETD